MALGVAQESSKTPDNMRLAITLKRSGAKWEVVHTPEVHIAQQIRDFKAQKVSPTIVADEIQIWTSTSGREKRLFLKPTPQAVPEPVKPVTKKIK